MTHPHAKYLEKKHTYMCMYEVLLLLLLQMNVYVYCKYIVRQWKPQAQLLMRILFQL